MPVKYLSDVPPPKSPAPASGDAGKAVADGATVYNSQCVACHRPNGEGVPEQFPPLAGNRDLFLDQIFPVYVVLFGLEGEIKVAGKPYNAAMPPLNYMPDAEIWGVSVQEMVSAGREVIIGMTRDPQFGPLIMFGLGGIYVEVLKDVTFRVAPINEREARDMLNSIRSSQLLRGVRGQRPADLNAIVDALRPMGVKNVQMPCTPERVWRAVTEASS